MSEPLFILKETNGYWSIQPDTNIEIPLDDEQIIARMFNSSILRLKDQKVDQSNRFVKFLQQFRKICK